MPERTLDGHSVDAGCDLAERAGIAVAYFDRAAIEECADRCPTTSEP